MWAAEHFEGTAILPLTSGVRLLGLHLQKQTIRLVEIKSHFFRG